MTILFMCSNFSTYAAFSNGSEKHQESNQSNVDFGVCGRRGKNGRTYRLSVGRASRCVPKLFSPRQPVNSKVELSHPFSEPTGCANLQVGATSFHSRAACYEDRALLWYCEMCCPFFFSPTCRAIMYVRLLRVLLWNIYFPFFSFLFRYM